MNYIQEAVKNSREFYESRVERDIERNRKGDFAVTAIKNGEVIHSAEFSYKLKKGRAKSSNAIDLLANLGYDYRLIEEARNMVTYFEEKGEWICV